jgi:hypothetical protein
VKRKAKQSGSGGRLRLTLLLASAAAFLLVPIASASAANPPASAIFGGSGSGWVKGEGELIGNPPLECHYNGTEIDIGTSPAEGSGVAGLHVCTTEIVSGESFNGQLFHAEEDPGSEFVEWELISADLPIGCEELTAPYCGIISFANPIEVKATFNAEPTPPSNKTPPTISGTAKEGKTLHGNAGTWSGGPESYTHQWWRCDAAGENCVEIAGAESTEYTATSEDVGSTLRFEETATNGLGSASAQSAATAVVVGAAVGSSESTKEAEVYGEVPQTTTLESHCEGEVELGPFLPGVPFGYEGFCLVTVTSTGIETSLTADDEIGVDVGHLTQKPEYTYSLAQALQTKATNTGGYGGAVGGSFTSLEAPVTLLTYTEPVSKDDVAVEFKQPIGEHDPLHKGIYSKVITLTLKQELP